MAMPMLKISTDGACEPNPGRGGWAYVLNRDGVKTEAAGTVPWTTNNQMELRAAIEALSVLPEPSDVEITSDSEYVVNGITGWIHAWKTNHWRTAGRKPVQNRALWEELDRLCQIHRVTWHWVRGHSGDPANERCDRLANQQAGIAANAPQPRWKQQKEKKKLERVQARNDKEKLRRATLAKISGSETEIRAKKAAGASNRQLAEQYGVPLSLIRSIIKNRDLEMWVSEVV